MATILKDKKTILALKLFSTIIITYLVISNITFPQLWQNLDKFNITYFAYYLIPFGLFLFLGGLNYYIILLPIKKIDLREVLKIYFIGVALGMYTPAYIGEFSSTAYLLKKRGLPVSHGLSVTTVDKFITIIITLFLIIFSILFYFREIDYSIIGVLFFLTLIPLIMIFCRPVRKFIRFQIVEKRLPRLNSYLTIFVSFFLNHPRLAILNAFVTIIRSISGAACIWVLLLGQGIDREFWLVVSLNFMARIVTYIPITINGIGLLEGSAIAMFSKIGISPEATLLSFLIDRFAVVIFSIIVFGSMLWSVADFKNILTSQIKII